jgi:hypothetical protein
MMRIPLRWINFPEFQMGRSGARRSVDSDEMRLREIRDRPRLVLCDRMASPSAVFAPIDGAAFIPVDQAY